MANSTNRFAHFGVWLALALLLPAILVFFGSPVTQQPPIVQAGVQHVVLDNGVEADLLYIDSNGNAHWRATVSGPKYLDDLKTLIECRWEWVNGKWQTGPNLFSATVDGTRAKIVYEGHTFEWSPTVHIGGQTLTPGAATLLMSDPEDASYVGNVLEWNYSNGIKRQLRIVEGKLLEWYIVSQLPSADLVVKPHIAQGMDFEWLQPAGAWDGNGRPIAVNTSPVDHAITLSLSTMQSTTFPITVDPDASFTESGDGCWVEELDDDYSDCHDSGAAWAVGTHDINIWVGQDDYFTIDRAVVYFDTSSLPDDCTIDNATLKLCGHYDYSDTDFLLTVVDGTGLPRPPLHSTYGSLKSKTTSGGSVSTDAMSFGGYNEIELDEDGLGWISKTGYTQFGLRSSRDISSTEPSGDEYVSVYGKYASKPPTLELTYTRAVDTPTVSTPVGATGYPNPSSVGTTSATLQGYLDSDGGEPCLVWFNYATSATYSNGKNTTAVGGFQTGADFSATPDDLQHGTLYYFRAMAANSWPELAMGENRTFLTHPNNPSNVVATATSEAVNLTWAKGLGANNTFIYYKAEPFSGTDIVITQNDVTGSESIEVDATEIYNSTASFYNHTGLDNDTTYYYFLINEVTAGNHTRYSSTGKFVSGTPQAQGNATVETGGYSKTDSSARIHGALLSLSGYATCDVGFDWYKDGEGEWGEYAVATQSPLTQPDAFYADLTGLDAASTYYYRANATNEHGSGYGDSEYFITGGTSPPTMQTLNATAIEMDSALLNGRVVSDGNAPPVTAWFVWGKTSACTDGQTDMKTGYETGSPVYDTIGDSDNPLTKETTYYFRVMGQNTAGPPVPGELFNFTTLGPSAPQVQTQAVPNPGSHEATLSGLLVSDGGVDCQVRFAWGATAACVNTTNWQYDKRKDTVFTAHIGGLAIDQTYYYKAQAKNDGTVIDGTVKTFTTVFGAPANFEAEVLSSTAIKLTWVTRGDQTYIVWKSSGYPVSRNDGSLLYFGSDSQFTHTGLTAGTTYYYRAWSWTTGDTFTAEYTDLLATTFAQGAAEQEIPTIITPPERPSRWTSMPNPEKLQKLPIYSIVNGVADAFEIPQGTFWFMLGIILAILMGVGAWFATHQAFVTIAAVAMGIGVGWWVSIIPMWVLIVFIIAGGGLAFAMRRI